MNRVPLESLDPEGSAALSRSPEYSEDALAQTFTARHGDELRYVDAWKRWLIWQGHKWEHDGTLKVFDMARAVCVEAADNCRDNSGSKAEKLASAKTRYAVVDLAKADRKHAATPEQWDADPWALNTPEGVVDLRDGSIRPNAPGDYCTKATAVSPGGDCPRWREFLKEITDGEEALQAFLQRMVGYCATGSIREHALFDLYGIGGNGKSVFLSAVAGILNDYHTTAAVETFTASKHDRHPTELASLLGARMVSAIETEAGKAWAESKIKALTGGDPISARYMHRDFFTFHPQFKLVIAGNHKPEIRNVDEAMRRRIHLVPFTVTIPPERRDLDLGEKLEAEWPGILQWIIEGACDWYRNGLNPPAVVRDATEEYLNEQDAFAAWFAECCAPREETRPTESESAKDLWSSWQAWAAAAREDAGKQKAFSERLKGEGFKAEHRRDGNHYSPIRLIRHDYTNQEGW